MQKIIDSENFKIVLVKVDTDANNFEVYEDNLKSCKRHIYKSFSGILCQKFTDNEPIKIPAGCEFLFTTFELLDKWKDINEEYVKPLVEHKKIRPEWSTFSVDTYLNYNQVGSDEAYFINSAKDSFTSMLRHNKIDLINHCWAVLTIPKIQK